MDLELIEQLQENHNQRLIKNPNLQYILDVRERYDLLRDKKTLSLNINKRKSEKSDRQKWTLATENKRRSKLALLEFNDYEELQEFTEKKEGEDIDLENDFLLKEGAQILSDYIFLNSNFTLSKAG